MRFSPKFRPFSMKRFLNFPRVGPGLITGITVLPSRSKWWQIMWNRRNAKKRNSAKTCDVYSSLLAGCIDSEKVKDIITSRNIQAPSPTAGLLDEIALALDVTSLVLSSWSNLAIKLGVPRKTCWEFERRSTDDPTHNLLHYLITTCPEMKLKTLKDALDSINRKDVLNLLQEQNQGGTYRKH